MQVTRSPQALRTTPMLLAVTPLPRPLTTPPVISTYLVGARPSSSAGAGGEAEDMAARGRPEKGRGCAEVGRGKKKANCSSKRSPRVSVC